MRHAPLLLAVAAIGLMAGSAAMWLRSHRTCDDLWYLTQSRTRTVGITSSNGQLAVMTTWLDGSGQFADVAGFRFDQHAAMNLATFNQPGRPSGVRLAAVGFLLRRFEATPCSPTAVGSTTRLTVVAVPYWSLVVLFGGLVAVLTGRRLWTQLGLQAVRRRQPISPSWHARQRQSGVA